MSHSLARELGTSQRVEHTETRGPRGVADGAFDCSEHNVCTQRELRGRRDTDRRI